jgi:hydroxyversicolorone monooxygenase
MASATAEKLADDILKSNNLSNGYYRDFQPNYKVEDHVLGDKSKHHRVRHRLHTLNKVR